MVDSYGLQQHLVLLRVLLGKGEGPTVGKTEEHVGEVHFIISIHASVVANICRPHPCWGWGEPDMRGTLVIRYGGRPYEIVWMGAGENLQSQTSVTPH